MTKARANSVKLVLTAAIVTASFAGPMAALAKADPNNDGTLKTGYQLLAQGESERAYAFFESKSKKYASSGACLTGMGKALKRLGKLDRSKVFLTLQSLGHPAQDLGKDDARIGQSVA